MKKILKTLIQQTVTGYSRRRHVWVMAINVKSLHPDILVFIHHDGGVDTFSK
jgi:hypothetical protein